MPSTSPPTITSTSDSTATAITAPEISLVAPAGNIGASGAANHIRIERTDTNIWTSKTSCDTTINLCLEAGGSIYIRTEDAGVLSTLLARPANFANTFSLIQTAGNIAIDSSSIIRLSATIMLQVSGTDANITINDFLTASSLSLIATGTITGDSTITGTDTLTLNATGGIGTSPSPTGSLRIARTSGTWSADNLTLTTGTTGSIYLRTASVGALNAIPTNFGSNTFYLNKISGNIEITSPINLPMATIELRASATDADIDLGANAITATSFTALAAIGNITGGTITAATISLTASNGSIGAEMNRTRIRFRSFSPSTSFSAAANTAPGSGGSVYLSTNNSDWLSHIDSRMMGDGMRSVILEPVIAVKKKEPGGFLSSALDPLLDLFGSGCEKDDILATVVSGFGILCGEE